MASREVNVEREQARERLRKLQRDRAQAMSQQIAELRQRILQIRAESQETYSELREAAQRPRQSRPGVGSTLSPGTRPTFTARPRVPRRK